MGKKINWKVRATNPQFWASVGASVLVPIMAYTGLSATDITTWSTLFSLLAEAASNPYVLMLVTVSVYNTIVDPTTSGFKDSKQALTYSKPKKEE